MASISIDTRRGRAALMVAHCAGMVDLVALPVWVGTLISHYRFDPQQAGADRVERAQCHVFGNISQMRLDTLAHLTGRLVGEGDGQDAPRRDAGYIDQVGDAVRDHTGLAGARPRQDQ